MRAILAALPTETTLREILHIRDNSIHNYAQIEYTPVPEVQLAYGQVLAFWTAATALPVPIIGPLGIDGAIQAL